MKKRELITDFAYHLLKNYGKPLTARAIAKRLEMEMKKPRPSSRDVGVILRGDKRFRYIKKKNHGLWALSEWFDD